MIVDVLLLVERIVTKIFNEIDDTNQDLEAVRVKLLRELEGVRSDMRKLEVDTEAQRLVDIERARQGGYCRTCGR